MGDGGGELGGGLTGGMSKPVNGVQLALGEGIPLCGEEVLEQFTGSERPARRQGGDGQRRNHRSRDEQLGRLEPLSSPVGFKVL